MLHMLSTSWRQLIANPLFSLITIASLSIGCCGALLAGANIKQHLSFERGFKDADRIVLVRMRDGPDPNSKHPMAKGNTPTRQGVFNYIFRVAIVKYLNGDLPDSVAMTRVLSIGSPLIGADGEPTKDMARFVDRSFFNVFEHRFIEGSKEAAFTEPYSVVLTQERARELLGEGPYLGKTLRGLANSTYRVTGVIDPPPQPSMFNYTLLTRVPETGPEGEDMASIARSQSGGLYVRMREGVDRDAFIRSTDNTIREAYKQGVVALAARISKMALDAGMPALAPADFEIRVSSIPITSIHLMPREATGVPSTGEASMLWALGGAAIALLVVSAFNYVVLSLARALRRRREVGLRKVLGASSAAVAWHYLSEAGLVTAISLAFGFGLAELLQPWFARALGQPEILFNLYDPIFLGGVAAAFLVLVLIVGAYPALYLAHIRPRTGLENVDDGGGRIRRRITGGLLGLQIAAATILLSVALTMALQARYVAERPLGFNMTNLYSIQAECPQRVTPAMALSNLACTATEKRVMQETPGIKRIAWSSNPRIFTSGDPMAIIASGQSGAGGKGYSMAVDETLLPLIGAKLLAGRLFDPRSGYDRRMMEAYPNYPKEKFDAVPAVVTRAMLPVVGAATPEQALGKRFQFSQASPWTKSYEIVGVIEDWHQRSLKYAVSPIAFVPGGTMMHVVAEIDEANVDDVRRRLSPLGGFAGSDFGDAFRITVTPLAQPFQAAYAADRNLMAAVIGFAALSILVACLGVFGLSAFDIQRRVREIGIRKALGATPAGVAGMVLRGSLVSAAIASVVSWPVAWWLSSSWLNSYVYRTDLGFAVLPAASLTVLAFVMLAVLVNTIRAATIRPSVALRAA